MPLGKIRKRSKQFVAPRLNITPMMDMFVIILIFLLFSFSDKSETVQLDKDLRLPESTAKMDYKENIKLVLSQTSLKLEDEIVANIQDGKIIGLDPAKPEASMLYQRLKSYRDLAVHSKRDGDAKGDIILFLCDRRLPFRTINSVVKTAGMAGYPNFQFAVLKK
ncbi:MAG: ExbD/TolR family protein [Nitrospinota bacterium]